LTARLTTSCYILGLLLLLLLLLPPERHISPSNPSLSLYLLHTTIIHHLPSVMDIPSIRSLASFAGGLLSQIPLGSSPSTSPAHAFISSAPSCPINGALSCHNTTVEADSCCFIYPGGQLLQTQFWDTSPSVGPKDSWTLHGLWYCPLQPIPTPPPHS
jgi:hypothetical protein